MNALLFGGLWLLAGAALAVALGRIMAWCGRFDKSIDEMRRRK